MSSPSYNATVIVTSDTCSTSPANDESGPYVVSRLEETNLFQQVTKHIVPDDKREIVRCIKDALKEHDPALLITIGGTGLTPRDVTPEATSSLYEKQCSGITFGLHMVGQRYSSHAALSRLTSGIVGGTLVINFPGSKKACQDCMSWLTGILEHALEMVRNDLEAYRQTHAKLRDLDLNGTNAVDGSRGGGDDDNGSPTSSFTDPLSEFIKNCNDLEGAFKKPARSEPLELIDGAPLVATTSKIIKTSPIRSKTSAAAPNKTGPSKRPYYVNRRGPSSVISNVSKVSNSSKLTIDALMDSRCEFPLEERSRPTSSIRTVNGPTTSTNLPKTRIMPLESSFPLIEFPQAYEILENNSKQLLGDPFEVDLKNQQKSMSLLGAVLAQDLKPLRIMPPYACSTMDGYVVNIPKSHKDSLDKGEIKTHTLARLVQDLRQFEQDQKDPTKADKFFCYQVNTGGRLPYHNYAVVPVERTKPMAGNVIQLQEILMHAHVRRPGVDLSLSDILKAGTVIGSVELAVILAMGHKSVRIYNKPRIGVLSTGDEIKDFFGPQPAGDNDVVDTNGPLLTAMFQSRGYFAVNLGVARDDPDRICAKLQDGLNKCDVILVTGGASMGTKDHVKSVIAHLGGKIHFGRVNMKPGKPVAFASLAGGVGEKTKFIFSLPGNPVSAFITTKMLALPFIHHGIRSHIRPDAKLSFDAVGDPITAVIDELIDGNFYKFEDRLEFVRAKIKARRPAVDSKQVYAVKVSVKQQSSRMLSLVDCDCLIMIDPTLKGERLTIGAMYPALKLHQRH